MAEITYEEALSAVQKAVAEQTGFPVADVTPDARLSGLGLGLDSLSFMAVLTRLESSTGIDLTGRSDIFVEVTVEAVARAVAAGEPADV